MTAQIALDLSHDGIAALSRAPEGPDAGAWYREGLVRLDAPDMADALRRLRARCGEIAGEGFTSILLIPDSQILYTSLERDDRDPKVTIRSQLAGRTPYAVEDLVFDYVIRGDRLQVAVVARDTLAEAEAFASDFGFRPVAHVAAPKDGSYDGLPQFGPTAMAPALADGARVSLDLGAALEVRPAPERRPAAAPAPTPLDSAPPEASDAADDAARDFAGLVAAPEPTAGPDPAPAPALPGSLPAASRPPTGPVAVRASAPPAIGGDPARPAFTSRRRPALAPGATPE